MFIYCQNNPANYYDPDGLCTRCYTCGLLHDCGDDWCVSTPQGFKYREEVAVLRGETNKYKDVFVVRVSMDDSAFTYGVIFIDSNIEVDIGSIYLLKHEYGHIMQAKELGMIGYTIFIVAPSIAAYYSNNLGMYYYDFPTEYIADLYMGVPRTNRQSISQEYAIWYWDVITSICDWVDVG